MRILAYDTSGDLLTAALAENGRIVREMESSSKERHSTTLAGLLEKLLKKQGWKPSQLDVLAVGVGPGSFTGLRVGVMTAKILGRVWKTKLVGVSSLEAIARSEENCEGRIPVVLDARRGRIYGAEYEVKKGQWAVRIAPVLTAPEVFFKRIGRSVPIMERPVVRAGAVALAAYEHAKAKKFVTAEKLEPLYLHAKDCNVTLPKK